MAQSNGQAQAIAEAAVAATNKQKRVRTGCLTCRERHLKCDETFPGDCLNCRKSSRVCKRGVKLNFIDTQCKKPPVVPATEGWEIDFMDESRDIASEYTGGAQQYNSRETNTQIVNQNGMDYEYAAAMPCGPSMSHQSLPTQQDSMQQNQYQNQHQNQQQQQMRHQSYDQHMDHESNQPLSSINSGSYSHSTLPNHHSPYQQTSESKMMQDPHNEPIEILNTRDETLYMQVFVEEVGVWMDSMDAQKHFSRLLPFHALGQPMLRNAFIACGVRHLTLVNPKVYKESDALAYYDKASSLLLRALQNPDRDSVICATTAVILNVYEIMTEKALPRMNHIAGARALIKECGWNARSSGIGAACFWINVGMELLSNLHFNWQASWHPDQWGFELDLTQETQIGQEEVWAHRIVYITAKVAQVRATISRRPQASPHDEQRDREKRFADWIEMKMLADAWNENIPRTMQPMAYLLPYQTSSGSAFPEVWLIKRTTIVARLFYHTCMLLLAQIHPIMSTKVQEMRDMELYHAHQICGIVAHVKDRGVASVAIRSLAIAGEVLSVRREQEEVLEIFKRIHRDTGWRIGFIPQQMREKWGWSSADPSPRLPTQANPYAHLESNPPRVMPNLYNEQDFDQYAAERAAQQQQQQARAAQAHAQQQHPTPPQKPQQSPAGRPNPPAGIVNPMFAAGDFSLAQHPYQEHYVAPSHGPEQYGHNQGGLGYGEMYWLLQPGYRHTQDQGIRSDGSFN